MDGRRTEDTIQKASVRKGRETREGPRRILLPLRSSRPLRTTLLLRVVYVLEKPQPREQLGIDRITLRGHRAQPRAGFIARHFVHEDVFGVVAAAVADPAQIQRAHEVHHLGAHARGRRTVMQRDDASASPAGFLFEFAPRRVGGVRVAVVTGIADQAGGHFNRQLPDRYAVLLDEQHAILRRHRHDDHRALRIVAFDEFPVRAPLQGQPLAGVERFGVRVGAGGNPYVARHVVASAWICKSWCARVRVSGPIFNFSHSASSTATSAARRSRPSGWPGTGASSAMRASRCDRRAASACARNFSASDLAPRKCRKATSSTRASSVSSEPKCASNAAAPFAPMPGTPGMLSIASPVNARKSTTWCASTPSRAGTPAAPQRWPRA